MTHMPRRPVVGGALALTVAEIVDLRRRLGTDAPEIEADDALWLDVLEGQTGVVEFCHYLARKARNFERLEAEAAESIESLKLRKARFAKHAEQARNGIRYLMEEAGITSLPPHPEATISLTKPRDHVEVTDEALIPGEYKTSPAAPPPKVDKNKLNDAVLRRGLTVPGVDKVTGVSTVQIRWE